MTEPLDTTSLLQRFRGILQADDLDDAGLIDAMRRLLTIRTAAEYLTSAVRVSEDAQEPAHENPYFHQWLGLLMEEVTADARLRYREDAPSPLAAALAVGAIPFCMLRMGQGFNLLADDGMPKRPEGVLWVRVPLVPGDKPVNALRTRIEDGRTFATSLYVGPWCMVAPGPLTHDRPLEVTAP